MPMQKITLINFYESWKLLLDPICDIDFQRRIWFRLEEEEVSTYEEATCNIMQRYLDDMDNSEYRHLYNSESGNLIKLIYEKLQVYTRDSMTIFNAAFEEKLLTDPKWLSIVYLAQKIKDTLNHQIKEVEYDKQ